MSSSQTNPNTPRRSARQQARRPTAFDCSDSTPFRRVGYRPPAVVAWQNKINQEWPNLTEEQRQNVRLHAQRWGPNQDPRHYPIQDNPNAQNISHEDWVRKRCFRSNYGIAKCHACWTSNAPLDFPYDSIPIGLDSWDRMPCGHAWGSAMIEFWLILIRAHTETYEASTQDAVPRIKPVQSEAKRTVRRMLGTLFGGQAFITWPRLIGRRDFRQTVQGAPNPLVEDPTWPPGTGF